MSTTTTTSTATTTATSSLETAPPLAVINYLKPEIAGTTVEVNVDVPGNPYDEKIESRTVPLHNAREKNFSADEESFTLLQAPLEGLDKCTTWEEKKALCTEAAVRIVEKECNATYAIAIYTRHRCDLPEGSTGEADKALIGNRPAHLIHTDPGELIEGRPAPYFHLPRSKDPKAAEALKLFEAGTHYFKTMDVWRPMKTIRRDPLVLLDYSSLDPKDIVKNVIRGKMDPQTKSDHSCFIHRLVPNPNHKWYYYPEMTPDEVLYFTSWHGKKAVEDPLFATFHSAVKLSDPTASTLPPRESVEVRVIALVAKE